MVAKRIIPCLDVKDGRTVKGVNFVGLRDVGDAVELGAEYARQGADELVYLDISATVEGRGTFVNLVRRIAERINIPFTVGGGISSLDDAARLLDAGADKISINSAAVRNPGLIDEIAGKYGSQFVVLAVDAKRVSGSDFAAHGDSEDKWHITTHGGRRMTDVELFSWVREGQERGAGEILLTSMDHDGTKAGYPCDLFARLSQVLTIPIIASGGAGSEEDIAAVLSEGRADAALAASIFHFGEMTVGQLKNRLNEMNIPVRI
jgi:cyclase